MAGSGGSTVFFCRPVNSKTARAMYPLPAKCWHLIFSKKFGQIPKYVGSLDGQMPHRYRASKSVKSPTNQRLFKNFLMRQIVYSNVNNTAKHNRKSRKALLRRFVQTNEIVHSGKPNLTVNIGVTPRVPNDTFEIFFHVVSYSWSVRFKVPQRGQ